MTIVELLDKHANDILCFALIACFWYFMTKSLGND